MAMRSYSNTKMFIIAYVIVFRVLSLFSTNGCFRSFKGTLSIEPHPKLQILLFGCTYVYMASYWGTACLLLPVI